MNEVGEAFDGSKMVITDRCDDQDEQSGKQEGRDHKFILA